MTDIFEGSLIRCFRRLQELIRQMSCAAKSIGNAELETKFASSLECLERPSSVVYNVCTPFFLFFCFCVSYRIVVDSTFFSLFPLYAAFFVSLNNPLLFFPINCKDMCILQYCGYLPYINLRHVAPKQRTSLGFPRFFFFAFML
jgi:hypothetical protein